ncbi:ferredoxin [Tranquillimonas rosea]|uniref:Ferredoxin n=1 Tax=Tranquillimonas rosea TaxID=641238 RepID=A0A1H9SI45_9RHOB|nr:ferredoxin family protein [Tranquillimonas rosea]SER84634.1 ferredoxin [Tranquillimonas rosea]
MTLVIQSQCIDVKDGICTTSCPVDCIYEGERMYYIHPTECIECGMCESICPVDAIRYDDEMEPEEAVFAQINADAFRDESGEIDEPGGWSKKDPQRKDPPQLAAFARRVPQDT